MLTRLGLRNFKAFGDEMQYADLAPITLIYGPNSGGKSSVIQALLMLKQSHEKAAESDTYDGRYSLRGLSPLSHKTAIWLIWGNYSSLIHNHDAERNLEVEIAYEIRRRDCDFWENQFSPYISSHDRIKWDDVLDYSNITDTEFGICSSTAMTFTSAQSKLAKVGYELTSSIGAEYKMKFRPDNANPNDKDRITKWRLDRDSEESIFHFIQSMRDFRKEFSSESVPNSPAYLWKMDRFIESTSEIKQGGWEPYGASSVTHTYGLPYNVAFPAKTGSVLAELDEISLYKRHIDRLSYLGPLMARPQRYYDMKEQPRSEHTNAIGVGGENVPQVLMDRPHLNEEIDEWLRQFDVPYKINAAAVSSDPVIGNELVAIYLTHQSTDTRVTLADVGFGINQILPVILQGVTSERKIICVEQPEIHLHPRLQANIADFLIETSRVDMKEEWVDGKKRVVEVRGPRNQWLVETHSELLVLRLQRRIREGIISHKDVSVLYVDPQDDGGSTIRRLELDEDGTFIDEWPQGFFEEGFREIMGY